MYRRLSQLRLELRGNRAVLGKFDDVSAVPALDIWSTPQPARVAPVNVVATFAPRQTCTGTQLRRLPQSQPRRQWRRQREQLERERDASWLHADGLLSFIFSIRVPLALFAFLLRATGLYRRGVRNALSVRAVQRTFNFADLPAAFDGYRILHITDPHFDAHPGLTSALVDIVAEHPVDLCVITGDYRAETRGSHRHINGDFAALAGAIRANDGIVATLGNHDCAAMVPDIEELGITVLNNELIAIRRGDTEIVVAGIDDVHSFYTDGAVAALRAAPANFRIAAVHSAELADEAAEAGYGFYLCGHSHHGQIAAPGGRPIITGLQRLSDLSRGAWQFAGLQGLTGSGSGVCGIPVRYNTRPEINVITLRRGAANI